MSGWFLFIGIVLYVVSVVLVIARYKRRGHALTHAFGIILLFICLLVGVAMVNFPSIEKFVAKPYCFFFIYLGATIIHQVIVLFLVYLKHGKETLKLGRIKQSKSTK